jgi:catechol-2,3-dioxygenase
MALSQTEDQLIHFRQITLETDRLEDQRRFYTDGLGLTFMDETEDSIIIQAGNTRLRFKQAPQGTHPFYHFAFNIPENKIEAAIAYLSSRVVLIPNRETGEVITPWKSWNADAIYFYDPAGNIVELIARHNLKNAAAGPFGPEDILYASEIGLPVPDVRQAATILQEALGLGIYSSHADTFRAMGGAHGLFILVNPGRPWWPTQDSPAGIFPIEVELDRPGPAYLALPGVPYNIRFTP